MNAVEHNQDSTNTSTKLGARPYRAAASLLLTDGLMSAGGAIAVVALFWGLIPSVQLISWAIIAGLSALATSSYIYFRVMRRNPEYYQQLSLVLWLYRFALASIWAIPQLFAVNSGSPELYIFAPYVTGFALIFNAFINLSFARYIAVFIPQITTLIYVTSLMPESMHGYSYLTVTVGFMLIPAAYAIERIFFSYLGVTNVANRYAAASAQAERQIEDISLALGDSQKRLQLVADNAHDIIILHDTEGRYLFVSNAVTHITGYYPSELIGNKPSDYIFHEDHAELTQQFEEEGQHSLFNSPNRFRFVRKDGSLVWLETITRPIVSQGADKNASMVSTSRDISNQINLEQNLRKQAQLDALTNTYNRAEFDRQLKFLVSDAKDNNAHHALLYIDLDQFKIINDSCGHQAGDALLQDVANRLKNQTGDKGLVARLGGDEFAILLSHCSTNDASKFANQLRNHLASQDFEFNQQYFSMAASFGIAVIDNSLANPEEALSRADVACYVAKASGRNGIHLWLDGDSMVSGHTENIRLATQVKQALDNHSVKCYGQLVIPLQEHQPAASHCEVLTRIEFEDGTKLTPDRYLPALEKFGLSIEYDHYVIETTLKAMSSETNSIEMGWGWVSINLSAQTICNPPSLELIRGLFEKYQVPPDTVCFEVTETAHLESMSSARAIMSALREMGCMLALDDFGSGHSSFEHLINLPFDIVKIDGQFIDGLADNPAHQSIVRSTCDLAEQLDILTVAEMVDGPTTTKMLKKFGVKYGQGFYLAGRQPLSELLATPTEMLQLNPKVLKLFADNG